MEVSPAMTSYHIHLVGAVDPAQRVASWRLVDSVVWVWVASWVLLGVHLWGVW